MNEQNTTPVAEQRPVISLEIVKATFSKELTKLKFQEALDKFNAMEVTSENVSLVQEKMKALRGFIKVIGDIKDSGKRPSLEEGRMWDRAEKDFLTLATTSLNAKASQAQIVLDKIAEENRLKRIEQERVEGINKEIDNFLLQTSQQIAAATRKEQLVAIEKSLGSHKGNKSRYQEFLPVLVERANELTPLIKQQKENIETLEKLEAERLLAEKENDDRKLLELQEQKEAVETKIEEKQIQVQEAAIQMAITPDAVQTVQPQQQAIKYRRTQWKWEVKDIAMLYKKMPHLVELVPNKEKIDEYLKSKKQDGSLEGKEEEIINGLKIYLEKLA